MKDPHTVLPIPAYPLVPPPSKLTERLLALRTDGSSHTALCVLREPNGLLFGELTDNTSVDAALESGSYQGIVLDARTITQGAVSVALSIRSRHPNAQLIFLAEKLEIQEVVQAMRSGVREVFVPPFDLPAIERAMEAIFSAANGFSVTDRLLPLMRFLGFAPTSSYPSDKPVEAGATKELVRLRKEFAALEEKSAALQANNVALAAAEARIRDLDQERARRVTSDVDSERAARESAQLEAQLTDMEVELVTERNHARASAETIARLQTRVNELEQAVSTEGSSRSGAESRSAEADRQAKQLAGELARMRTAIDAERSTLNARVEELKASEKSSRSRVATLETELTASREAHRKAKEQEQQIATLEAQLSAERSRTKELTNTERDAARALGDASAKLDAERRALTARIAEHETTLHRQEEDRKAREERLSRREIAVAAKEKAHIEAVHHLDEKARKLDADTAITKEQSSKTQAALAAQQAHEIELSTLEATLGQTRADLEAERSAFTEERAALATERAGFEAEMAEHRARLESNMQTRAATLKERETKVEAREQQVDRREAALTAIDADLAIARGNLERELADLKTESNEMETERATLAATKRELEVAQAELTSRRKALGSDSAHLTVQKAELERAKVELAERTRGFESKRAELQEQMRKLLSVG